jgi:hypothetical protein
MVIYEKSWKSSGHDWDIASCDTMTTCQVMSLSTKRASEPMARQDEK